MNFVQNCFDAAFRACARSSRRVMENLRTAACVAIALAMACSPQAQQPLIPPTMSSISPAGMERGTTATFTVEGRNLSDATEVFFDTAGIGGKVTRITDVAEQISGPRAGEDLEAQVPRGKKQIAELEVTVAKDAIPGIHRFRIKTPLGTTNIATFAVGTLPEIGHVERPDPGSTSPQLVTLQATLIGNISAAGNQDTYAFDGKAGDDIVFEVQASKLGSELTSMFVLTDSPGKILATAGRDNDHPDAVLTYSLTKTDRYTISISDRDRSGGPRFFYRLNVGTLPYIFGHFPLGVTAGHSSKVAVDGVNLGGLREVTVSPTAHDEGWTTIPLKISDRVTSINDRSLAVGSEPEMLEQEPNDSPAEAQVIFVPATIDGHIGGRLNSTGNPDEDYFKFHATKGELLDIDVAAARLGSSLDSVIEVLDSRGNALPRATVRCLNQTTTTLADRDSRTTGIRLISTSELHEGDYLMVGDELNQIDYIPDQPDADTILKGADGIRIAYLGTSPDVHAINTPVYKAQVLPAQTESPSNGLPVFQLTWRNDDGGPGYGSDSKLDFVAPEDGDYLLNIKDVRGLEGPDFAYRLTIRNAVPDFQLKAEPVNPNIPRGRSTLLKVSVIESRNYDGPIRVEVKGLPQGVSASPASIPAGQDSTVVVLSAAADPPLQTEPTSIKIIGHASVNGRDIVRTANTRGGMDQPLQLASIVPAPDVIVTTDPRQVFIESGKEAMITLHIYRQNGFKGRVPCFVDNLPPGVRVVNVGLNGVLVTETQSSRTFTLRAEDWAQPIKQPIYVVAQVESNSPTMHPSEAVTLEVAASKQTMGGHESKAGATGQTAIASGTPKR